jgi:hypothetical protein
MTTAVLERRGQWWAYKTAHLAGPFANNAEAWQWLDRNTDEGRADLDRYNQIRMAFAEYGYA